MTLDDGTALTYTVKNGEKGEKGDNAYTWVKYASQEPTEESHSMGDIPDDWRGEYNGPMAEAPTDWKQYKWFRHKGEKGDTGAPATLVSTEIVYQSSYSGTIIPSGAWSTSIPVVAQGKYLWKRTTRKFNSGEPEVSYDVNRMGIDGTGAVSSVAGVSPDPTGNVALTAANVGAMPTSGGDFTGPINMNGQKISGLNDPTGDTEAARKSYVDKMLPKSGGTMTGSIAMGGNKITDLGTPTANTDAATKGYVDTSVAKAAPRNLLDNSDFTNLVAQAGIGGNHGTIAYAADRWILDSGTVSYEADVGLTLNGTIRQKIEHQPAGQTSAFVGMASGAASISYADGAVTITSSGGVLKWAALYKGEYTAETLPEYQPKGYGAERAECQRYYLPDCGRYTNGFAYGGLSYADTLVPTPVKMRGCQVNVRALDYLLTKSGSYKILSISGTSAASNGVNARVNVAEVFAESQQCTTANLLADIIADL